MGRGAARCGPTSGVLRARRRSRKGFYRYDRRMRPLLLVLGGLLIVTGLVWVAQGLNLSFAPSSFMTADRAWILIGVVTAAAGTVLVSWARRPGPDA